MTSELSWQADQRMVSGVSAPRAPGSQDRNHRTPLGTAEWLQFPENNRPKFEPGDIVVGRTDRDERVGYHDDRHVLVTAGTRGGKGASFIIPNLLTWPGSLVVNDPKGENAMVTARRRGSGSPFTHGMGQIVHLLDPGHEASSEHDSMDDLRRSYNPLDLITTDDPEAIETAARIAGSIVPDEEKAENFFEEGGRGILRDFILMVVSDPYIPDDQRNLGTVRDFLIEGDGEAHRLALLNTDEPDKAPSGMALLLQRMQRNRAFDRYVGKAGARLYRLMTSTPKTFEGMLQVAVAATEFIDPPEMRACLAKSDFKLSDLKTDDDGVSLFICSAERHMASRYRWLRMMTDLIVSEMERVRTPAKSKHKLLLVLDEFASLKRMKSLESAAAQIAGYGVKLMFVVQTLAQLKSIYRDNWETFVANANLKVFFGNDDDFTRSYVSKLVGDTEVGRWSQSASNSTSSTSSVSNTAGVSVNSGSSFSPGSGTSTSGYSTTSSTTLSNSVTHSSSTTRSASATISESVQRRPLITPDEVGRIFGDRENPRALVLVAGHQPLNVQRVSYFADEKLAASFGPHHDHAPPLTVVEVFARAFERRRERTAKEAQRRADREERDRLSRARKIERDKYWRRYEFWSDLRHYALMSLIFSPLAIEAAIILNIGGFGAWCATTFSAVLNGWLGV